MELILKVSTSAHFSFPPGAEPWLRRLFPSYVAVRSSRQAGDPSVLTAAEAAHVARAVPQRRQEFAAGRACAKAALASLGAPVAEILTAADRQPLWPAGFLGSITHTTGLCVAVGATRRSLKAVGIDAEVVGAPTRDIWSTVCGDEELRWVSALAAADRPGAVTLLFAAKEAFYKCQYPLTGQWLDFHDLVVAIEPWAESGSFAVRPVRAIDVGRHASLPLVGRFEFHEGWVAAGISIPAAPDN